MRIFILFSCTLLMMASCNRSSSPKKFTVNGTIENSTAKMIYLEKNPATSEQPTIADSAKLGADGKFSLHAQAGESVVYNIRLDQNMYPVASVINDTDQVKLTVRLSKENNQFAEKYEVEGSPASEAMKDFMYTFNNDLKQIFTLSQQADSIHKAGAPDSTIFPIKASEQELANKIQSYTMDALAKANDPALIMFELGYYQSTAGGTGFGLQPLTNEEIQAIVNTAARKFPSHTAIAAIKNSLDQDALKAQEKSFVGKEAPEFALPDVNGKEVKLSSFRGKYVLVDFWASWCGPCRGENPNVVKVFNEFRNKNFTVLGVSLDRPGQKDKWLKAIKDDHLAWTHVSDLQYWDSPVVQLYRIEGIPFNVLVDPQGKVVAQELRGRELEKKLEEVLK